MSPEPTVQKERSFPWPLVVKVVISGLLLTLLARAIPLRQVMQGLARVPLESWLINTFLMGLATAMGAYRWHLAALRQIPLRLCLSYYWMGLFYGFVLPGSVAGDVARTAALATLSPEHRTVLLPVSVFIDRLGGLVTMLLVFALACSGFVWAHEASVLTAIGLIAGLGLAGVVMVACPQIASGVAVWIQARSWLPGMLRRLAGQIALPLQQISRPLWLKVLGISLLIHLVTCWSYALSAQATGVHTELWRAALFYAVLNLAVMLPITIAGVGLREQSALWLLGKEGASGTASVAMSWFVLATTLVHVLIGAGLHLFNGFARKTKPEPTGQDAPP